MFVVILLTFCIDFVQINMSEWMNEYHECWQCQIIPSGGVFITQKVHSLLSEKTEKNDSRTLTSLVSLSGPAGTSERESTHDDQSNYDHSKHYDED